MKNTKQIMRKCLSISLSALMLTTYLPGEVFAQSADRFISDQFTQATVQSSNKANMNLLEELDKLETRYGRFTNLDHVEASSNAGEEFDKAVERIYQTAMDDEEIAERIQIARETYFPRYTVGEVQELKAMSEDYLKFLINLEESGAVLDKLDDGKESPIELLAERYSKNIPDNVADDMLQKHYTGKTLSLNSQLKKGSSNWDVILFREEEGELIPMYVREEMLRTQKNINTLKDVLKNSPKDPKELVKNSYKIYKQIEKVDQDLYGDLFMSRTSQTVKRLYSNYGYVLDFQIPEKSKAEFLENLYNEIMRRAEIRNPELAARLQLAVAQESDDALINVISKLQAHAEALAKEATTKAVGKNTIPNMLKVLKSLNTPEAKRKFAQEMADKLTEEQKQLVREITGQGDEFTRMLIGGTSKGAALGKDAGKAAGKIAGKTLSIAAFAIGSLIAVNYIYNVDGKGNTFESTIPTSELKRRVNSGETSPYEALAYISKPSNIEENPVLASKVISSLNEAVTNPEYVEMLKDDILVIKGWNPDGKEKVSKELDKRIQKMNVPFKKAIPVEEPII